MTTWFASDLHLNHDRDFIVQRREFTNVHEMDASIRKTFLSRLEYGDTLYLLGDIAMTGEKYEIIKSFFSTVCGLGVKIVWHLGNHDNKNHPKRLLEECPWMDLEWIPMKETRTLREDSRFATSHFPLKGTVYGDNGEDKREEYLPFVDSEDLAERVLLHGHTHSKNKGDGLRMIHVGFDARAGLVSLEEVIAEHMNARRKRAAARKLWCSCGPCSTGCKPSHGDYCGSDACVNARSEGWLQRVAEDAEKRIMQSNPLYDDPARAILRKAIITDSDKIWKEFNETDVLPG